MFKLRTAQRKDLENLYELSLHSTFINLPPDQEIISKKIDHSLASFENPSKDFALNYYIFVLEDLEISKVVGASMIHAQHGTEEEPHYFFRVGQENKFSTTLNTGFIHGTLTLGLDTNGPTEIGGLILDPSYRGSPEKLGKQLSFIRFLYMGLNPTRFKEEIHSELMPPFDKDGRAPLWEAIGRRFLNMEYHDADVLSRSNKEFILNLFPANTIYETLLPIEARVAIGKVGGSTLPVKKMLEEIGFTYINEVDPFDGGPHYRAKLKDITPVKNIFECEVEMIKNKRIAKENYLITIPNNECPFTAIKVQAVRENNILKIDKHYFEKFKLDENFKSYATTL